MNGEIPKIAQPKQPPARGDYLDRKRTLPARVGVLGLRLAQLQPGRYVLIIQVEADGRLTWEEATVK